MANPADSTVGGRVLTDLLIHGESFLLEASGGPVHVSRERVALWKRPDGSVVYRLRPPRAEGQISLFPGKPIGPPTSE